MFSSYRACSEQSTFNSLLLCNPSSTLDPAYRSARAEILEFHQAQPEDHLARPSQKFIFRYFTRTPPKPDFLLFQPQ
jgi:hypothetical protein